MAFDGKKFGEQVVALMREYVERRLGETGVYLENEIETLRREVSTLALENKALVDLVADLEGKDAGTAKQHRMGL